MSAFWVHFLAWPCGRQLRMYCRGLGFPGHDGEHRECCLLHHHGEAFPPLQYKCSSVTLPPTRPHMGSTGRHADFLFSCSADPSFSSWWWPWTSVTAWAFRCGTFGRTTCCCWSPTTRRRSAGARTCQTRACMHMSAQSLHVLLCQVGQSETAEDGAWLWQVTIVITW